MSYTISPDQNSITCHRCGLTSHHPEDVRNRYCGKCHIFHDDQVLAGQATEPAPIDTANHFAVGLRGDRVAIIRFGRELSRAEALNLAAWLCVLADAGGKEFVRIVEEIRNT